MTGIPRERMTKDQLLAWLRARPVLVIDGREIECVNPPTAEEAGKLRDAYLSAQGVREDSAEAAPIISKIIDTQGNAIAYLLGIEPEQGRDLLTRAGGPSGALAQQILSIYALNKDAGEALEAGEVDDPT